MTGLSSTSLGAGIPHGTEVRGSVYSSQPCTNSNELGSLHLENQPQSFPGNDVRYHLEIFMLFECSMVLHSAMTLLNSGPGYSGCSHSNKGKWAFREAQSPSFSKAPMHELGSPSFSFPFSTLHCQLYKPADLFVVEKHCGCVPGRDTKMRLGICVCKCVQVICMSVLSMYTCLCIHVCGCEHVYMHA